MFIAFYLMEEFVRACEEAIDASIDAMVTPMVEAWAVRELERHAKEAAL